MYKALNKVKNTKEDFDIVVKITQLHNFDEYTNELRLTDNSGESWFALATKLKFPHLCAGQVIRVRSCNYDESSTQKNMLSLSHYSNIMSFLPGSKLAAQIGKAQSKGEAKTSTHANIITEPIGKLSNTPVTSLSDLFKEGRTVGTTFRVCL
jgi:hypothetical protein